MDDSDRLDQIRRRVERASRAPWRAVLDNRDGPQIAMADGAVWDGDVSMPVWTCDDPEDGCMDEAAQWSRDATFIAHARVDVPWLLAEVERLRALER